MSANGRYVAFLTNATNLTPSDTHPGVDVYVLDRDADQNGIYDEKGTTGYRVVNRAATVGEPVRQLVSEGSVYSLSMSADGRFVAFSSTDPFLTPGDGNFDGADVFVRDRDPDGNGQFDEPLLERTTRVSVGSRVQETPDPSFAAGAQISANGRFVFFQSDRVLDGLLDLAPGVTRQWVRDRDPSGTGNFDVEGTTTLLSRSFDGGIPDALTGFPNQTSISPSGRYTSFLFEDNQGVGWCRLDRDADGNGVYDEFGVFNLSDYFDFSIYIDADESDIESWYVDRFLRLCDSVFQEPESFFRHFAHLSRDEAIGVAKGIWGEINGLNLRQNIEPTRERASLILRKGSNHRVSDVFLRKL
ncbi:MAG: hypothetical protein ACKO84_08820 [Actinomycetota bacterium]